MAQKPVVKSVGRVFDVLEYFRATKRPKSAIEVGRSLDFPQSSTMALLKSMTRLGYLTFDCFSRTYMPSLRVTILGDWIEQALLGRGHLAVLMSDLRYKFGETIALFARNDLDMQVVHVTFGSQSIVVNLRYGQCFSLHDSAAGLAVLAYAEDEERHRIITRLQKQYRSQGRIEARSLERRVVQVRRRGVAVQYEPSALGLGMVALALPTKTMEPGLALTVAGPAQRIRRNQRVIAQSLVTSVREQYTHVHSSEFSI